MLPIWLLNSYHFIKHCICNRLWRGTSSPPYLRSVLDEWGYTTFEQVGVYVAAILELGVCCYLELTYWAHHLLWMLPAQEEKRPRCVFFLEDSDVSTQIPKYFWTTITLTNKTFPPIHFNHNKTLHWINCHKKLSYCLYIEKRWAWHEYFG